MATSTGKRPASSSDLPNKKKARLFATQPEEDKAQTGAKVDPTYGQRGAFPGLDENGEDELSYGPADDGLAYLRMVRLEARGVPNLLVAPKAVDVVDGNIKEEDLYAPYETRDEGWYSEGAYTAAPVATAAREADDHEDQDPQEAYYAALLDRFDDLRDTLSSSPHASSQPVEAAVRSLPLNPKSRHWKHALLKSKPTPLLLNGLPQHSVILGIEELEALLTTRNLQGGVRHKLGAWAWGLLGRCRDVSEMDSEDVSVLRGLGKKACALLRRLRAGDPAANTEVGDAYEDDWSDGSTTGAAEETDGGYTGLQADTGAEVSIQPSTSLEDARKELLAALDSGGIEKGENEDTIVPNGKDVADESVQVSDAHATLDMIATIVGECYGQRDLLDGRLAWEEL